MSIIAGWVAGGVTIGIGPGVAPSVGEALDLSLSRAARDPSRAGAPLDPAQAASSLATAVGMERAIESIVAERAMARARAEAEGDPYRALLAATRWAELDRAACELGAAEAKHDPKLRALAGDRLTDWCAASGAALLLQWTMKGFDDVAIWHRKVHAAAERAWAQQHDGDMMQRGWAWRRLHSAFLGKLAARVRFAIIGGPDDPDNPEHKRIGDPTHPQSPQEAVASALARLTSPEPAAEAAMREEVARLAASLEAHRAASLEAQRAAGGFGWDEGNIDKEHALAVERLEAARGQRRRDAHGFARQCIDGACRGNLHDVRTLAEAALASPEAFPIPKLGEVLWAAPCYAALDALALFVPSGSGSGSGSAPAPAEVMRPPIGPCDRRIFMP